MPSPASLGTDFAEEKAKLISQLELAQSQVHIIVSVCLSLCLSVCLSVAPFPLSCVSSSTTCGLIVFICLPFIFLFSLTFLQITSLVREVQSLEEEKEEALTEVSVYTHVVILTCIINHTHTLHEWYIVLIFIDMYYIHMLILHNFPREGNE